MFAFMHTTPTLLEYCSDKNTMKYKRFSAIAVLAVALIAVKAQEFYSPEARARYSDNLESKNIVFKVDTAKITISVSAKNDDNKTNLNYPVEIYYLSDYCHDCSYQYVSNISGVHQHFNETFLIDTKWNSNLMIVANLSETKKSCSVNYTHHYGERGEYHLAIIVTDTKANATCHLGAFTEVKSPINSYIPILVAFCILLGVAVIYLITDRCVQNKMRNRDESSVERFINSDLGVSTDDNIVLIPKPERKRMKSIDSFRGACIVIMIFVNYKGGRYWFFHHAAWHGLTVADLVFPWFMFIMGINIVLSIDSLERKATPRFDIAYKIIRRTFILFFLGLCIINHNTDFVNMRIPGVLQRFAIAYCVVALLHWIFHTPVPDMNSIVVMASVEGERPWWYHVRDIRVYWIQWLVIFGFEAVWHCITFLLPVEGCPTGYLGPGGLADQGRYFNCTGGAAGYIDKKVFGEAHIYGGVTARKVYFPQNYHESVPYDPEGLLGTIHSILIVFLGLQAGKIYLYYKEPKERIMRWLCWSLFLGVITAILTKCSQYDGWIPVNKNLWSTTFVTTLSCFAFFILPVMYYIIDVKEYWSGVPFYFAGMNSIFLYVGHEVFEGYLPFAWGAGDTSTHAELLAMNMLGTAYWVVIAYYCYKIKFFVKI